MMYRSQADQRNESKLPRNDLSSEERLAKNIVAEGSQGATTQGSIDMLAERPTIDPPI